MHGRDHHAAAGGTERSLGAGERVQSIFQRMFRVCRLDSSVYPEIESDRYGLRQGAMVVAFVTAAAALGTVLDGDWHRGAIVGAVLAALIRWLVWGGLSYLVAAVLFRRHPRLPAVLAGSGYAQAPQLLAVLGFLEVVGPVVVLLSRLLTFLAGHRAMEHALGLRRRGVMATTLVTFVITFVIAAAVQALFGEITLLEGLAEP